MIYKFIMISWKWNGDGVIVQGEIPNIPAKGVTGEAYWSFKQGLK